MAKMNWNKHRHAGKALEADTQKQEAPKGCWSHIKREPVHTYTDAEIAAWAKALGL